MDDPKFTEKDKEIEYLRSRLLVAENDAENLENALTETLREFDRVNAELTTVYSSRRWKFTGPLTKLLRPRQQPWEDRREEEKRPVRLDRKTVLVIDHHVPEYDKNAGDRSTFGYIQLLAAMGYHIAFMGADFEAKEPYTAALVEMGVSVLSGAYYASHWRDWVAENGGHICAAVISRPLVAKRFMRFIRQNTEAKIVYFGHDLHYIREERGMEASGATEREISVLRAIEHAVMKDADVVMMFNDEEKDVIKKEFGVEAATVPLYFYYDIPARKTAFEETKDLLFVGGFSHKPNVDAMLWFMEEIFPLVRQALPDVGFVILGSNPPPEILEMAGGGVTVTGFVTDAEMEDYYARCRVCVVPLRFGAGVKGKTVEAMYYSIPIVSTTTGIEGMKDIAEVIPPVDAKEEFAARVVRLYLDKNAWEEAGAAYRKYLLEYYSFAAARGIFEKVLGEPDGCK